MNSDKSLQAELTAAKAEIARLEGERDLHVLDSITVRAEFVMMRDRAQSAEAKAARLREALEDVKRMTTPWADDVQSICADIHNITRTALSKPEDETP